jgi:hypothetical protein
MAVAADYARVIDALRRPLPAYMAFVQHDHVTGMANVDDERRIVVRTADHAIVHGKTGDNTSVKGATFDPACYQPTAERTVERDGHRVLAFDLRPTCGDAGDSPFTVLFADAATMLPLQVTGDHDKEHARVTVDQRFTQTQGHTVPSSLVVGVDGDGAAFWLHVHVEERYRDYHFSATDPGA